jgi:hypothetical protein
MFSMNLVQLEENLVFILTLNYVLGLNDVSSFLTYYIIAEFFFIYL